MKPEMKLGAPEG